MATLIVRRPGGEIDFVEDLSIQLPGRLSSIEEEDVKGIVWVVEQDGRDIVQRPTGSGTALSAYAKANPFSARLFSIGKRVRVQENPDVWEWKLPDGSTVIGMGR